MMGIHLTAKPAVLMSSLPKTSVQSQYLSSSKGVPCNKKITFSNSYIITPQRISRSLEVKAELQSPMENTLLSRTDRDPHISEGTKQNFDTRQLVDTSKKEESGESKNVLIECNDVYKSFGEKHILRGVSFKIHHGEAIGIIGPSGTGKSTILKIMAGLLAPDKGELHICGKKRQGLIGDEEISDLRIGLVFQSAALFDSLTVRENVGFMLYEQSTLPAERIEELVRESLEAVGLKGVEDRFPSELSGGMKKRVALARAIIFDDLHKATVPEVVMYDEPTAGLDPIASTVVEDLIRSMHIKGRDARGKPGKIASYIVVTHQHSTIQRAVDRLLFLHEGRIVWQGSTSDFHTSTNPIVRQFASGSLDGPIQY
eukprot:TRINITY_DN35366_c0_g1_i1.p1 TRINITY_DN35366_c0_g1~~TRINITY_DN35366_c0_g1_i1.p1  ORF type:complete len:371 (+),score=74.99 TRINITY_DN35366_c0_g1_i1:301-1413(+)